MIRRPKLSACHFRASAACSVDINNSSWRIAVTFSSLLLDVRGQDSVSNSSHLSSSRDNFYSATLQFLCGRRVDGYRFHGGGSTDENFIAEETCTDAYTRVAQGVNYARKQYYRRNYRMQGQTLESTPRQRHGEAAAVHRFSTGLMRYIE